MKLTLGCDPRSVCDHEQHQRDDQPNREHGQVGLVGGEAVDQLEPEVRP